MCLGIPAMILEIQGEDLTRTAKVDFGGVVREVSLAYVPEAQVGDYVIVHVGFALSILNKAEAQETWRLLQEIGVVEQELGLTEGGTGL
jgi:hydrogenase expression/formation protein HypC